jgi:regulator of sigma E protease
LESRENPQPNPELNPPGPEQRFRQGGSSPAPSPEETEAPAAPAEPSIRQWLAQNGSMLAIVLVGIALVHYQLGWDLATIAKVAVGLGFIIFIHELGHFLVAKWCDVHVQVFSIGFGPALPGCRFTWGETTYKLSLIPLGGYVQMVGQVDGDESADGTDDDPRSYRNKSVWQRMAIISAGVTMNALLAVVCFVIVFRGPGKARPAGIVAGEDSNGPAFQAGIPTGAVIRQIGDLRDPNFEDLMRYVMATQDGDKVRFRYQVPGQPEQEIEIQPRLSPGELRRPMLGIAPPRCLELLQRRYAGRELEAPVLPRTAAADQPFEFGDAVIATTDPANPKEVADLPLDPRKPGSDQRDYFEFARRMRLLAGQTVTIRVLRGDEHNKKAVDITVPPAYHNVLGARMGMGQVTKVCDGTPAATDPKNRLQARANNLEGDVIQKVEVPEPDGTTTIFEEGLSTSYQTRDPAVRLAAAAVLPGLAQPWALHQALYSQVPLDPVRLPDQLRQWARNMARIPPDKQKWDVTLHVRRHNEPGNPRTNEQYRQEVVRLPWLRERAFAVVDPRDFVSPLPIPELGLAYQVKTTVVGVDPALGGTGDDALQPGDVIQEIRFHKVGEDGKTVQGSWASLESDQWATISYHLQPSGGQVEKVDLKVLRNGETRNLTLVVRQDPSWPLTDRGLIFATDVRWQKADSIFQAVEMGLKDTYNSMLQVYQNLRGMVTGRISLKNLGGPVTIARAAYNIAGVDFWEFIFFLGLISINLAVINFLPIPVLDGGHMVFLIYEKIRGKPASEQIRVGATYAGLLLLASLMIFVLYLDISRIIRGG